MKQRFVLLLAITIVLAGVVRSPVFADEAAPTDAQIATIRSHCSDILVTLNRLKDTDTLLRYDRGQLYRTIADKLMSPLNQRIASSQLDGSELVATTAEYNKGYQAFFDAYRDYNIALADTAGTDCTKQPNVFYDRLKQARTARMALHDASARMVALAQQYKTQFDAFRAKNTVDEAAK